MDNNLRLTRRAAYLFFSRAFARPFDDDFLSDCKTVSRILSPLFEDKSESIKKIGSIEGGVEDFARLYGELFLTGARGHVISPCESVYFSGEGLLMGEERDAVLKIYSENFVSLSPSFSEPEDHISAELAFMAAMAEREKSEGLKVQSYFLENHLIPLADFFTADVGALDRDGVYSILSKATCDFIKFDKEILDEIMEG